MRCEERKWKRESAAEAALEWIKGRNRMRKKKRKRRSFNHPLPPHRTNFLSRMSTASFFSPPLARPATCEWTEGFSILWMDFSWGTSQIRVTNRLQRMSKPRVTTCRTQQPKTSEKNDPRRTFLEILSFVFLFIFIFISMLTSSFAFSSATKTSAVDIVLASPRLLCRFQQSPGICFLCSSHENLFLGQTVWDFRTKLYEAELRANLPSNFIWWGQRRLETHHVWYAEWIWW